MVLFLVILRGPSYVHLLKLTIDLDLADGSVL